MTVSVPIKSIALRQGSAITLHSLTWQDYENILGELGEDRHTRIAYYEGNLEIISPLSRYRRSHRITSNIVTAILDAQGRDWDDFGSTTLYRKGIAGVEPNTCFYVANAALVRDCQERIDVDIYPPPDLVIESDVTSVTFLSAYEVIATPEMWLFSENLFQIYLFRCDKYYSSDTSLLFPDLDIKTMIPELVNRAIAIGASSMLREFRKSLSNTFKES